MRYGEPIEDLLFLLSSNAVVFIKEIKELGFRFFQRGVGSRLEISEVGENSLFKLFGVCDGSAKGKKPICQRANYICSCDMEKIIPEISW